MLPRRQPLESRHALGHVVVGLLVDGVDRHLGCPKQAGIVERVDLDDDGRQARRARHDVRAAFGAEFPRHRAFQVGAGELLRRSPVYLKPAIGIASHMLVEPPEWIENATRYGNKSRRSRRPMRLNSRNSSTP